MRKRKIPTPNKKKIKRYPSETKTNKKKQSHAQEILIPQNSRKLVNSLCTGYACGPLSGLLLNYTSQVARHFAQVVME